MKKRVIAAVDDLFFAAKIRGTAASLDVEASFPKTLEKLLEEAKSGEAAAVIFDLQAKLIDAFEAARLLKSEDETRSIPLFGFYSHIDTELRERAKGSGIDEVMPRSVFNQRLMEILGGKVEQA